MEAAHAVSMFCFCNLSQIYIILQINAHNLPPIALFHLKILFPKPFSPKIG